MNERVNEPCPPHVGSVIFDSTVFPQRRLIGALLRQPECFAARDRSHRTPHAPHRRAIVPRGVAERCRGRSDRQIAAINRVGDEGDPAIAHDDAGTAEMITRDCVEATVEGRTGRAGSGVRRQDGEKPRRDGQGGQPLHAVAPLIVENAS